MKILQAARNTLAGIAVAAAFFVLGSVGAVEHDSIPFKQFCIQAVVGMAIFGASTLGAATVQNEINWRGRK